MPAVAVVAGHHEGRPGANEHEHDVCSVIKSVWFSRLLT